MHINMKYYVVTISAIFIALGIGILIGFNLDGEMFFSEQQTQIIQKLEERLVEVKSQKEELEIAVQTFEKNREQLNNYVENSSSSIIENELEGKTIGMVYTTEDYFYPNVAEFIKKASGEVAFELLLKDTLAEELDMNAFNQEMGTGFESKDALVEYILKTIMEDKNFEFANALSEKGYVKFTLYKEGGFDAVDSVVIAAGSMDENKAKMDLFDGNITRYFNQKNINAVEIEKKNVEFSYVSYYKKSKTSTIDNVDSITGKISLVMALGGKNGHFGEKETAEELMPKKID
ncbi:Copper transport outer membrane protein, MctB [Peptoclostridium litorale DSM 5388]|uniref:Uncharacterized protein n=1 Tax=Peptoclostridium litorale DSM 5388 TaxID=1121324 RepID=A0A069RAU1_PEPLI|nr:copper transporter [Peptoclostridium litorale]KDR94136.1 hypothetical protein CLIT_23c04090 [Peptoclostridium litorale DSM 5388]SIN81316.1 Copper transport outer membrane protein, MctB [Peptoclostridium litorale DSM 5388]